jgi:hypothetical protein
MRVADAALDAKVGHLGYSSVGGAERRTGIEHFKIAGHELTFAEVAGVYEKVTGVPTRLAPLPLEERLFE